MTSMEKLLTVSELAERLGISAGTAYHWLSQGRLPAVRFSKRCVRFRESDVQKMLEQLGQAAVRNPSTPNSKLKSTR
jgi:excisionase family DNA binding protein